MVILEKAPGLAWLDLVSPVIFANPHPDVSHVGNCDCTPASDLSPRESTHPVPASMLAYSVSLRASSGDAVRDIKDPASSSLRDLGAH